MNRRTIYDQELFAHFVTFSCYRRRRILDHDQPKRIVLGMLGDQLRRQDATCVGFVVMPDHVHAVVWFPETGQLSRFVHGWKRRSSYEIGRWLAGTNKGDRWASNWAGWNELPPVAFGHPGCKATWVTLPCGRADPFVVCICTAEVGRDLPRPDRVMVVVCVRRMS